MEKVIRERFNDRILAAARQRYRLAEDALTDVGGFESFMYSFTEG